MMEFKWVDGGVIINFSSNFPYDYVGIFGLAFLNPISRDDIFSKVNGLGDGFKLQLLNYESITSWRHVASAAMKALRNFKYGTNISRRVEVELLLYCSGFRQIRDAIKIVGLSEFVNKFVLVVFGLDECKVFEGFEKFTSIFPASSCIDILNMKSNEHMKNLMKIFNISEDELKSVLKGNVSLNEALEYLLIERGSMLDALR
ncbi:MAG: KEOPS complex subunit Cgi121 [Candidatus Methanomethylicia archaeon]